MREFQPVQYYSVVRPEFMTYTKRLRACTVAAALLLAAGFVLFILSVFFSGYQTLAKVMLIAAAATFGPGAIIGAVTYRRTALCNLVAAVVEQVRASESLEIEEIELPNATAEQKELVLRALLDKGNLPGYALEEKTRIIRV